MIFQRAIRRELLNTVGAVFTVLFTIVMTVMLIRILGDAAAGKIAPTDVAAMLGFAALGYFPVIITLTAFIAVLMVVARSYQDSEMVIWLSSGVSLKQWIGPMLSVGIPMVILTAALSIWLTPWANKNAAEYKLRFKQREDLARISPGKFQESSKGDKLFFVEGRADNVSEVRNVFVLQTANPQSVVVAQTGKVIENASGEKSLVLFDGYRYEGNPNIEPFRFVEFESYSVKVFHNKSDSSVNRLARTFSTLQLIRQPTPVNLSELMWRISVPIMCAIQILLAIPLGFVSPRRGRSLNLMIAILLAISYHNIVAIIQSYIATGKLAFASGWWVMHLIMLVLTVMLFVLRENTNSQWHPVRLMSGFRRLLIVRNSRPI
jgi:lipopolysaccharide export system permease protein